MRLAKVSALAAGVGLVSGGISWAGTIQMARLGVGQTAGLTADGQTALLQSGIWRQGQVGTGALPNDPPADVWATNISPDGAAWCGMSPWTSNDVTSLIEPLKNYGWVFNHRPGESARLGRPAEAPQNADYWVGVSALSWGGQTAVGSWTFGINGEVGILALNTQRAFRWTASQGAVALTLPAGFDISSAKAISYDGSVVVGSVSSFADAHEFGPWGEPMSSKAAKWKPDGTVVVLDEPSYCLDVSADGSVVLGNRSNSGQVVLDGPSSHPFIWTEDGQVTLLGPGEGTESFGQAISGDGQTVVGWVMFGGYLSGPAEIKAAFWRTDSGWVLLEDVLAAAGLGLDGLHSLRATDVSFDGRTILGEGLNEAGQTEAWVVTIPEPASLGVMVGGLVMGLRRRRG